MRFIWFDCDLISLLHGVQAETLQALLDLAAGEPVEKLLRCLLVFGGLEDDSALTDLRVAVRREENEGAEIAIVGRARDGERDESYLGVAGLGELSRLADVFGDDEFVGDFVSEAKACEGFVGGKAVGCVLAVGNGDLLNLGAGETVEREGLGRRILSSPEDEDAMSVGDWDAAGG